MVWCKNLFASERVAQQLLKRRQRGIAVYEVLRKTKRASRQLPFEHVGKGRRGGGGVVARKRRYEVLDRPARLGQGLSPAQRNDFSWFKDARDARRLQEHGGSWVKSFIGWAQRLLGENEDGVGNAFSVFV